MPPSTNWSKPSPESTDWSKPSVNSSNWERTGVNSTNWNPGPIFTDYYLLLQDETYALLYQDEATFIGLQ